MNKQINNSEICYFYDEWGQYVDIELNYPTYVSRPFPFSTSKPKNPTPMLIPAPLYSQFKSYNCDIQANYPEEKKEYNKFNEENINLKGLKSNINITSCITVSIITYVLYFIV